MHLLPNGTLFEIHFEPDLRGVATLIASDLEGLQRIVDLCPEDPLPHGGGPLPWVLHLPLDRAIPNDWRELIRKVQSTKNSGTSYLSPVGKHWYWEGVLESEYDWRGRHSADSSYGYLSEMSPSYALEHLTGLGYSHLTLVPVYRTIDSSSSPRRHYSTDF